MYLSPEAEFKFIYDDLKAQSKEIPSLPLLLKSIEKTTKKLDCINLYSAIDRRDLDFQLFEKEIYEEITQLVRQISQMSTSKKTASFNMERIIAIQQKIEKIKQSKMQAFDQLDKLEEILQYDIERLVDQQLFMKPSNPNNEIKEVEQDDYEMQETEKVKENSANRVEALKLQIEELNKKISKLNRGKGKWFDGDHRDFVKLYNRFAGEAERIIEEGTKVLGMKNIQIVDHLEVYESYLQLEKEKKLVSEEFKTIKMFEQEIKNEEDISHQLEKQRKEKEKKRLKEEQQMQKKLQIQEFKRKKDEEKERMLRDYEKTKEATRSVSKISVQKKRQIENRNKRLIQQKQEQFKTRVINSSESKIPPKPPSFQPQARQNAKLSKISLPEKKQS